jgi:ankyrin repeat protein
MSRSFVAMVAVAALLITAAALVGADNVVLRGSTQMKEAGQEPSPPLMRIVPTVPAFEKGVQPIHMACRSGSMDAVRHLADRGADLNARTQSGWMPMHFAALSGNIQIVRFLAAQHCSVKDPTSDGISPLAIASAGANLDVMKYLTDQGAEVNQ